MNNFGTVILCYEKTICSSCVLALGTDWVSRELNGFIHTQCNSNGLLTVLPAFQLLPQTVRPEKTVHMTQNLFYILVYNFRS
jgi:hypothetical protein